ncbi:MAG: DUF2279 domain-containing protein [Bacteroidales bacterium]|nr:DUF2279 domain-containing protein [Bacteroidales bacterium]
MKKARTSILIICLLCFSFGNSTNNSSFSESTQPAYPDSILKNRIIPVAAAFSGVYAGSMITLYSAWYKDYPTGKFHFFNDNLEWLQMDKASHALAAYSISRYTYEIFRWTGMDNKKAVLWSSVASFGFQTSFEIFDGFSQEWGFSWGDVVSNGIGTSLFAAQQLLWQEQYIHIKYSYQGTQEPNYRPNLLGSSYPERFIKNYNGITVWTSINPSLFLPHESSFPKWLSLAIGYRASGMTGGFENPSQINGTIIPHFDRQRHFYLAPDIDLSKIKTKNKTLNAILFSLNYFKFPLPGISFTNKQGFRAHWIVF